MKGEGALSTRVVNISAVPKYDSVRNRYLLKGCVERIALPLRVSDLLIELYFFTLPSSSGNSSSASSSLSN